MAEHDSSNDCGMGFSSNGEHAIAVDEHIVEVISDSGEGCAEVRAVLRDGGRENGKRRVDGRDYSRRDPAAGLEASRAPGRQSNSPGSGCVTNGGDQADLVVAFNEQVLLGRLQAGEIKPGGIILLEEVGD